MVLNFTTTKFPFGSLYSFFILINSLFCLDIIFILSISSLDLFTVVSLGPSLVSASSVVVFPGWGSYLLSYSSV